MSKYFYTIVLGLMLSLNACSGSDNNVGTDDDPVIEFQIPSELAAYYSEVDFSATGTTLLNELHEVSESNHTVLSYGARHNYLYSIDEDAANTDNVILMYTGESRYWEEYTSGNNPYSPQTFNTEHIYPQSLLTSEDAVTDLHHLRVCDADVNSQRSNYPYQDGVGNAMLLTASSWYPGDEWKGDVARMILYLNVRYGESFNKVGYEDLFLDWNEEDPVSSFEIQRNNRIEAAQGNRNPFIDNPYLATLIWGGDAAENSWE
ncbi:endonuclease [Tamlana sp. 62-3]|uniref:Endonuclease n=1 Tax=Neotamlana sargassicola TaxID=2883125 RepID=A0A9X1L3X8_9FLAO|nr:endonuclease [Tamlana sargassicola]MCB4807530.1 endonuclease [Tamlana sargassicola]